MTRRVYRSATPEVKRILLWGLKPSMVGVKARLQMPASPVFPSCGPVAWKRNAIISVAGTWVPGYAFFVARRRTLKVMGPIMTVSNTLAQCLDGSIGLNQVSFCFGKKWHHPMQRTKEPPPPVP
eukprot:3749388-Karenia_brevis.AAC.1